MFVEQMYCSQSDSSDVFSPPFISQDMSVRMEMDINGVSRAHVSILPTSEIKATLKPEAERPRCASTPCSPIRGTVSGYQILHMDSNYLVSFTTGEELLKLAHKWSEGTPEKGSVSEAMTSSVESAVPNSVDLGIHRSSRICKAGNSCVSASLHLIAPLDICETSVPLNTVTTMAPTRHSQ
ncbi:macrophage immunometabolism regulator isoform X2 [Anarrhichthys ocellatus]|uniref:macrophage immunometabolism regulator isoform X2 n=1 Tax=Anarrhichthys ocellatus TaxID=433405 RepID=UPI0012ECDD9B|nr:UNC119-binding protein C5orf30 homolog isoform X2 [Anarrhichthys ocellatus]